ncbi:hypothetical protein QTG54_012691 [Skeletonema marinoi]|uniref:S1 motif domain-containing protein n=1 Tax=Skeletonema marinoi TaxID=267567 RepID=A0AAD8XZU2_9STRA|nr:hypothetical protein QTG54_012691 [Skeletonema marinoi]
MAASSLYSTAIAASFICSTYVSSTSIRSATDGDTIDSMFGPRLDGEDDEVLYSDDDDSDDWGAPSLVTPAEPKKEKAMSRWGSLNPKIKAPADLNPGETVPGRMNSWTPSKVFGTGDDVEVRIVRMDPGAKKLQLTMLPEEVLHEENVLNKHMIDEDEDDRIQLDEIEVDDELWGEIRRVTDYGAYIELVKGAHPKEFMRVGDRVRVWVLDVDSTQQRIKLTANRPSGLPGPRREVKWI